MKTKLPLIAALLILAFPLRADLLDDLLGRKEYEPIRLSEAQMDSILNPASNAEPARYTAELRDTEGVWRHSRIGVAWMRDTQKKREWQMSEDRVRELTWSASHRYLAYGKEDGNLYVYKADYKTEVAVSADNRDPLTDSLLPVTVFNGMTDWLYEEEFGVTKLMEFSPDDKFLAYIRLNDKDVPMTEWGPYPKAGEPNPIPEVCLYDMYYKTVAHISLPKMEECYIPRIWWESKPAKNKKDAPETRLMIKRLNRDQNRMEVYSINPKTQIATLVKKIENPTGWVDVDAESQEAKVANPNRRYSADGKRYIEWTESVQNPPVYTLWKAERGKSKKIRVIEDNAELKKRWEALELPEKEFFEFVSERGDTLKGWMLRPIQRTKELRRYPVVMTQYSGPESQRVLDRWSKRFEYYLASIGYIVVCVDPRGTGGRSKEWLEATYMNLGKKEAEDQIATAHYVASLPFVDASHIDMIGWSYGGYTVIRTLEEQGIRQQRINEAALIRRGVAIAPVTDWRLYDSAYTERYMRRPQVNEDGYEAADLKNKAEYLTGELLLVHGLKDDNVHPENTLLMIQALVAAEKHFELMIYPDDNHFLRKGRNNRDVHERLLKFIQ